MLLKRIIVKRKREEEKDYIFRPKKHFFQPNRISMRKRLGEYFLITNLFFKGMEDDHHHQGKVSQTNNVDDGTTRVFPCLFCSRKFCTSQAWEAIKILSRKKELLQGRLNRHPNMDQPGSFSSKFKGRKVGIYRTH